MRTSAHSTANGVGARATALPSRSKHAFASSSSNLPKRLRLATAPGRKERGGRGFLTFQSDLVCAWRGITVAMRWQKLRPTKGESAIGRWRAQEPTSGVGPTRPSSPHTIRWYGLREESHGYPALTRHSYTRSHRFGPKLDVSLTVLENRIPLHCIQLWRGHCAMSLKRDTQACRAGALTY